MFSSSAFLHWCYSYKLTNVKICGVHCNSIHFPCNVWEKVMFTIMYLIIKSVWVSGSRLLISYVNVVALLNTLHIELTVTFVTRSFCVPFNPRCQCTLPIYRLVCALHDQSIRVQVGFLGLHPSALECCRVPWNAVDCYQVYNCHLC
jgi:hypothetical protein